MILPDRSFPKSHRIQLFLENSGLSRSFHPLTKRSKFLAAFDRQCHAEFLIPRVKNLKYEKLLLLVRGKLLKLPVKACPSSVEKENCNRNFRQFTQCVWKNEKFTLTQCGNLHIIPHDFLQKFRQINCFTKAIKGYTVNQFDGKFLQWGKISEISTL